MYVCINIHTYTGLKIGRFVSPNANYNRGKCESLTNWFVIFWVTANLFRQIANHLC